MRLLNKMLTGCGVVIGVASWFCMVPAHAESAAAVIGAALGFSR
jgi:hypothetical protein